MKISEKHANGATIEITFDLDKETRITQEMSGRADKIFSYVEAWRASQPSPEPEEDASEKGKSGATAYFSAEQDRTYDVDNGPHNYAPVIKAHSISLRVNEGVSA